MLMAGNKRFFYYANQISSPMGIDLSVFCMNAFDRKGFQSGFTGVLPKTRAGKHYHLSATSKAFIAHFYDANPRRRRG